MFAHAAREVGQVVVGDLEGAQFRGEEGRLLLLVRHARRERE